MNISLLNFTREFNQVGEEIMLDLTDKIRQGNFILQQDILDFEKEFANYCDVPYSIGVASGTAALHLALVALGVEAGDEVITSSLSFNATAQAIAYTGATPVFVDIEPETGLMDITQISERLTKKTKAIIPVHLYGLAVDVNTLKQLCQREGLFLVEDCAQAHGTLFDSRQVGTFGNISCFSFMPAKNLGAYGDAGSIITSDLYLAESVEELRNHGRKEKYIHHRLGYAERMDNLQAVVLRHKLKYLNLWNEKRRKVAEAYYDGISSKIRHLKVSSRVFATYYGFQILVTNRDKFQANLKNAGIETNSYYPVPLHRQPVFDYLKNSDSNFPIVNRFCSEIISLPMNPFLTDSEIEYIIENVNRYAE
jgi:dTDP-4-amino-4,6-dideoxygalactose transaminase